MPHYSSYVWQHGEQYNRVDTVLANLASGGASWRALCPPRSGFEGGGVEVFRGVVVCTLTRGCD
jgi:hypothetical protein